MNERGWHTMSSSFVFRTTCRPIAVVRSPEYHKYEMVYSYPISPT